MRPARGADCGAIMRQGLYRAGLEFPYPEDASSLDIVRTLRRWAKCQPTVEDFPWRLAPALYADLCTPRPDFAFAELCLFCKGEAARRIFEPRTKGYHRRMLAGILRHRPQIAGIFYEHLRYRVKEYLLTYLLDQWPECQGVSPLGYGPLLLPTEEIESNRRDLLAVISAATRWYERTLAKIGNSEDLDDRASGHELHHWIGGARMPPSLRVPVTVVKEGGSTLIGPCMEESKPILDAGWILPEYEVEEGDIELAPPPAAAPKPAPTENKPPVAKPEAPPAAAPADDIRQTAAKALELATHLDDNPKVKAPNHLTVFRLYCVDALPLREIARRCKCSPATILNRKTALETRLRHPLDTFRTRADEIRPLAGAAEYAKARRIRPRDLAS